MIHIWFKFSDVRNIKWSIPVKQICSEANYKFVIINYRIWKWLRLMHYTTATLKMTIIPRLVITSIKWTGSNVCRFCNNKTNHKRINGENWKKIVHIANIHYKDRKVRQNHTRMCAYWLWKRWRLSIDDKSTIRDETMSRSTGKYINEICLFFT